MTWSLLLVSFRVEMPLLRLSFVIFSILSLLLWPSEKWEKPKDKLEAVSRYQCSEMGSIFSPSHTPILFLIKFTVTQDSFCNRALWQQEAAQTSSNACSSPFVSGLNILSRMWPLVCPVIVVKTVTN